MHNPVVSRDEWLNARIELLRREKELTRLGDEVARQRQELPWVRVDKTYRFDTDDGSASLAPNGRNETGVRWRRHDEDDVVPTRQLVQQTGG
jgi:predicted dithiol-disulfide oxidoreductase (DUF899 family)